MASEVDIANQALSLIGNTAIIQSLSDGVAGKRIQAVWAQCRDYLLSRADWNFATVVAQLVLTGDTPVGYTYEYHVPSPRLRIGLVSDVPDMRSEIHYVLRHRPGTGDVLVTDAPVVYMSYVYPVETPGDWSPAFAEAMARYLAATVAPALSTLSADRLQALGVEAERAIHTAMAVEQSEETSEMRPYGPWVTNRARGSVLY